MANANVCPHCGQKIRPLNPHRMDRQKVRVLEDIAKMGALGYGWVKVSEGDELETIGHLIHTAYRARAHASRLVWFGLLDWAGRRTGRYKINERGLDFLLGRISVPEEIFCKDGKVVHVSDRRVYVDEVRGVILDKAYWDNYALEQVREVAR